MRTLLWLALITAIALIPARGTCQKCEPLASASPRTAADYIDRAGQDADAIECIEVAFHRIALSAEGEAVPLLLSHLAYKRPLNESERIGVFMHGNGPSALYPAVHELAGLGAHAEQAILDLLADNKPLSSVETQNAIYALLLINHGNAAAVIRKLHMEAASSTAGGRSRLDSAAQLALRWCDERHRSQCVEALR